MSYLYRVYRNVKKAKIQGGDSKVYVLVKRSAVESGTNFLEASRRHTAERGTYLLTYSMEQSPS